MTYVPWDASYLSRFRDMIQGAIGTSVNIGILAFGMIMVVFLIVRVVRFFTRG